MSKNTVLFVDDEPKVLNGLRRMLYPLQNDWNMLFAESGTEGLEILAQMKVTILISDMRMPIMNGFELLQTVFRRFPEVIRVMLTGQPNKDTFCDVATISHYFLWKPANYKDLKALFDTIRDRDASLHTEQLLQLLGGINSLPSSPPVFDRLMELIESQEIDNTKIAAVINEDISMTAQILRLAHSISFGQSRQIETVQEAVSHLGLNILRQLILEKNLFSRCSEQKRNTFQLDKVWQHSLDTATLAKALAERDNETAATCNSAYIAGLLHNIGKLILIRHLPEIYAEILEDNKQHEKNQTKIESERLGANHAIIGGQLASLWGLPHTITEAISLHHAPLLLPEISRTPPVMNAVWHANRISKGDYSQSIKYQDVIARWQHIAKAMKP